jgi:hypothetical protein
MYFSIRIIALSLFLILNLFACDSDNGKEDNDNETITETNEVLTDYSINISVSGIGPNAFLIPNDVELNFSGAELWSVSTGAEEVINNLLLTDSIKATTLYLRNPPEENQDVKVVVKAEGYFDTGASLVLSDYQNYYQLDIKLVSDQDGDVAPGIKVSSKNIAAYVDDAVTNRAIEFSTESSIFSPGVRISIPTGTEMTDNNGLPVDGAVIKIASFNPFFAEALEAYPGGLRVLAEVDGFIIDGLEQFGDQEIDFKSAAFAAITIEDETGKKVKKFSSDIEVALQILPGTKDPDGKLIAVGDQIPIWTYDEDTGKWTFEEQGIIQDLDPSDFLYDVLYQVDHLTYTNLDWEFGRKCTTPTFTFVDERSGLPISGTVMRDLNLYISIESAPAINRWLSFYKGLDNNSFQITNTPAGFPGSLTVFDQSKTEELGSLTFADACEEDETGFTVEVLLDSNVDYEKALQLVRDLDKSTSEQKKLGLKPILADINAISRVMVSLLLEGENEKYGELTSELDDLIPQFAVPFLKLVGDSYEQRLSLPDPFIDTDFTGLEGYGCFREDIKTYLEEVNLNATFNKKFGGEFVPYFESTLQFVSQALIEFYDYSPQLVTQKKLVSEFVRCGIDYYASLIDNVRATPISKTELESHLSTVIRGNVEQMRAIVDSELNFGGGDLPGGGVLSSETAQLYELVLNDALAVIEEFEEGTIGAGRWEFSPSVKDAIDNELNYLQQLKDDNKIGS